MNIETWPLDKIIPYEKNAKLHQVEWIATSIREFQPDQPIVVDGDGVIIKGHGRLKAAQSLGLKEFPVVVRTDLTPEQVRLARIADNRTNEGGWNTDLLSAEISELMRDLPAFDFASLGMTSDWFSNIAQGEEVLLDSPDFEESKQILPVLKIQVSELEYDSLRRDISNVLKGYESPKFI